VQAPTLAPVRTSGLNSPPRARRPSPESCGARAMIFEVWRQGRLRDTEGTPAAAPHGPAKGDRPGRAPSFQSRRAATPIARFMPVTVAVYSSSASRAAAAGSLSGAAHPSQLLCTGGVWSASQILPKKRLIAGSEGAPRFLTK
jgi:hypothetical protein